MYTILNPAHNSSPSLVAFSVGVFERLRSVLHEAQIEKRTQYMIEVMFQVRKDGFKVSGTIQAKALGADLRKVSTEHSIRSNTVETV